MGKLSEYTSEYTELINMQCTAMPPRRLVIKLWGNSEYTKPINMQCTAMLSPLIHRSCKRAAVRL